MITLDDWNGNSHEIPEDLIDDPTDPVAVVGWFIGRMRVDNAFDMPADASVYVTLTSGGETVEVFCNVEGHIVLSTKPFEPVEADTSPTLEIGARVRAALECINKYGGTGSLRSKQWVLDQVVRTLTGCPKVTVQATDVHGRPYEHTRLGESPEYLEWVRHHKDGEDGPDTYDWDVGIAP